MAHCVVIIDYGSGNLHSAAKAVERAGSDIGQPLRVLVSKRPDDVRAADRVILPGVGAFGDCRAGLDAIPGLVGALEETVLRKGRPFLGICVGMQLMATKGLEFGETVGFNWIPGRVEALKPRDPGLKIPHMGWNTLNVVRPHALLNGLDLGQTGLHGYFVHSFQFVADSPDAMIADTEYGGRVTAMIGRENLAGTQFHPEKSQKLGLGLLANFLRWAP